MQHRSGTKIGVQKQKGYATFGFQCIGILYKNSTDVYGRNVRMKTRYRELHTDSPLPFSGVMAARYTFKFMVHSQTEMLVDDLKDVQIVEFL